MTEILACPVPLLKGCASNFSRYYLTPDRKASQAQRRASKGNPRTSLIDVLLGGSRVVHRLGAHASSAAPRKPKTLVGVPVGTSPGRYWLLACADDRGTVKESRELNNCRAAAKPVAVRGDIQATLIDALSDQFNIEAIWSDEDGLYFLVQQQLFFWTNVEREFQGECIEPPGSVPPGPQDPGQDPALQALPECPKAVKALSASVEFIPGVKLKANCEKVTLSLDTNPKSWITAFAEVSFDSRAGKLTVLAGSKGSIGSGPLGGTKAAFKSGIYVTVGSQGVTDAGWRVGPSFTTTNGALEYTAKDEIDLSFVDAFSATFGT